jgi:hypothetical protein
VFGLKGLEELVLQSLFLAIVNMTNRFIRMAIVKARVGFASNDRQERKTEQQLTVADAKNVGVSSDIATITANVIDFTCDNRSKFVLREEKQLLSCAETVRFIVGEEGAFGELR